ncbi:CobW family GTP-binding protein [Brevibacillus daliensis]|uniref:CobW family GTP-binding protein n=1 Tax=Brevibacillus daliensis TaxID=2892995 RepID=UPI001E32B6F9|nr:GTP-binding protein [Brevibacillus daliensis]
MSTDVYILSGYLGSGKTTLLQQLLAYFQETNGQVVVMMNEMGEEDIDGEQLEGFGFPVKKMLDGCICCSIRGELTDNLQEIFANMSPDQIIIETTGVADPIDVVDALTHPDFYDKLTLKGLISVIDASRFLDLNSFFQSGSALIKTVRNQVKYADLLLLNKVDLVKQEVVEKVKRKLTELNPLAPLYLTIRSELDIEELLTIKRLAHERDLENRPASIPLQKTIVRQSALNKIKHTFGLQSETLYHSIQTFAYHFKGPVNEEAFEDFLYALPKTIYRAKGYVQFKGKEELISFQQTQTQVHLFPFPNHGPKMVAVFIGEGFDQTKIIQDLETCCMTEKWE